jgi:hypothetical protein
LQVTITVHPSWLKQPTELRGFLAALTALEAEYHPRQTAGEPRTPVPARRVRYTGPSDDDPVEYLDEPARGDDGLDQLGAGIDDTADEDAPRDGRQLLGWCGKQVPDQKGTIMSFGKKHGLHTKIVAWTPEQVAAAYRYARAQQNQGARS